MMRSLKARLLVGTVAGMVVLLAVFGAFVYAAMSRALTAQFDESLTATARTLAATPEADEGEFELDLDPRLMPDFGESERAGCFQFWLDDGSVLARSPSLAEGQDLPRFAGTVQAPARRAVTLPGGRPGRAVGVRFVLRADAEEGPAASEGPFATLVVARDADRLIAELRLLAVLLISGGVMTVAAALLVGAAVVRRGLRPVESLAGRIATIGEDDLQTRIEGGPLPTEMAPVVDRLNQLLGRLEGAFERERRFSRDVAHELRTPLAGLRATMEVALSRRRTPERYETSLGESLAIVKAMHAMVESLLELACLEAGRAGAHAEPVLLAGAVDECWREVADKAEQRRLTFENGVPRGASVAAAPGLLALMLGNLLDNAAEYADEGGRVWVRSEQAGGECRIEVANTGCGLTPDEASHVFERFWRADAARTDTGLHAGLGLPLVCRAAAASGGTATATVDAEGTFTVTLALPAPA